MSKIDDIYKKVALINEKAADKGFNNEKFMMIQSDGMLISFYGYFFETIEKSVEEEFDDILIELETIEFFIDNFNLI